jgi:hypothetical protein
MTSDVLDHASFSPAPRDNEIQFLLVPLTCRKKRVAGTSQDHQGSFHDVPTVTHNYTIVGQFVYFLRNKTGYSKYVNVL